MVDLEELKKKFRIGEIAAYGTCIIVPFEQFQAEWDEELLEQGIECHAAQHYVYVKLPKEEETKVKPQFPHDTWTEDEDKLLIKLWNRKGMKVKDIHKQFSKTFPDRTPGSVKNRCQRLVKRGLIKSRFKQRRKTKTQEPREPKKPEPTRVIETSKQNGYKTLRLAGWIYALYVEQNFIEYFATAEQAKQFQEQHYANLSVFIKPIAFFKYDG